MLNHEEHALAVRAVTALETIAKHEEAIAFHATFMQQVFENQMKQRDEMIAAQKAQYEEWQRQEELRQQVEDATPEEFKGVEINPAQLQVEFMYNLNEMLKRQLGNGGEETQT